jgi:anti-sigma regulatory factor (Ser/Thr protein kinase)
MITGTSLQIFTAEVDYSFDRVDNIRQLLSNLLREYDINEEIISHIELSVYEAIINIIEHSPKEFTGKKINIDCSIEKDKIYTVICNYGRKFDITKTKLPDIEEHYVKGKKRGLGVFFIRTLMDKIKYSYKDNINCTTLIKDIHR